jgi:hypothetical protein
MHMNRVSLLIAGVTSLSLWFVVAPVFTDRYRRYRNRRKIICPDRGQIAEVEGVALAGAIAE